MAWLNSDAITEQHSGSGEYCGWDELPDCQSPKTAGMEPVLHLITSVTSGFAPVGKMFAVVEQQVVILLSNPKHCSADRHFLGGTVPRRVVNSRDLQSSAEVLFRTAQNFPSLQVVGNRAIPKVNPVVVEQPMLTGDLQVVGYGQVDAELEMISIAPSVSEMK